MTKPKVGAVSAALQLKIGDHDPILLTTLSLPITIRNGSDWATYELGIDIAESLRTIATRPDSDEIERLTRWKAEVLPVLDGLVEALKLRATDAEANARQAWDVHRETVDRLGFATLRADKAEATIQRMRAAMADHPRACEAHPEDDPISCGWKRAVLDVQTALDGGEPDA